MQTISQLTQVHHLMLMAGDIHAREHIVTEMVPVAVFTITVMAAVADMAVMVVREPVAVLSAAAFMEIHLPL